MQRSKKGLSNIVGAIFLVAIVFTAFGIINWSIGLQDQYALTVSERNQLDWERLNERIELTDLSIDNNKFNITLQNTGTLPTRLVRLWVTNETSSWHDKYDLDYVVNPTSKLTNLGQSLSLNALETQDYTIGAVTERGNLATFRIASPSNQALNLNLHALPSTVSSKFQVTLMLSVNNNLTNVDVIPKITPVANLTVSAPAGATYTKISGPTPAFDEGLLRGETTFFKWIYEVDGSENQVINFTASLEGGKPGNNAIASVTIKKVEVAKIAEVSVTNSGLLSIAFTSLQWTQDNGATWNPAWKVPGNKATVWKVNLTNNDPEGRTIYFSGNSTMTIVDAQSANTLSWWISSPNYPPLQAYSDNGLSIAPSETKTLFFGSKSALSSSGQSTPTKDKTFAMFILLFGHWNEPGSNDFYGQNIPYQAMITI